MISHPRFQIVIANRGRASLFVDNFSSLRGFNPKRDALVVFDCTPDEDWKNELATIRSLAQCGLTEGENLLIFRRKSWNLSHGAQLDYLGLLADKDISQPQLTLFMQDHYLDLERFVKEDTVPAAPPLDLDHVESVFHADKQLGCCYLTRNGIRISVSTPITSPHLYGEHDQLVPGATERGLFVDGANFFVRPELYLPWLTKNRSLAFSGHGDYGSAFVWEIRLGQILYDQRIRWHDLSRGISFQTIDQLHEIERARSERLSHYWYDSRVWFFFHGRDLERYLPVPPLGFVKTLLAKALALRKPNRHTPASRISAPLPSQESSNAHEL